MKNKRAIANTATNAPFLLLPTIISAYWMPEIAASKRTNSSQGAHHEEPGSRRDPEERPVDQQDKEEVREKMLDKTLSDSFPTSDPPSSIPDPTEDDSFAP